MSNEESLTALQRGKITVQGEFLWGSNYTFLAQVEHSGMTIPAVYKPTRGERPLWDFPVATLARREVAAYLVSEALGWELVPPTIYRNKGPIGPGSLQLFIEHDPEYHYFNFDEPDRQRLRPVVLFDILINNADRKGSHVLIGPDQHLWLIDHGICFHVEEKLRTVIWDFVGEPIPVDLCNDISQLRKKLHPGSELVAALEPFINRDEIEALGGRADDLITLVQFPPPNPYRRPYPWPQI
ncbi:MAG TPA: SCO1664 family protein [Anaerolineales bacterium]